MGGGLCVCGPEEWECGIVVSAGSDVTGEGKPEVGEWRIWGWSFSAEVTSQVGRNRKWGEWRVWGWSFPAEVTSPLCVGGRTGSEGEMEWW